MYIVYSNTDVSNSLPFYVIPAADPTPGQAGNEMSNQFDLLLVQIQETFTKLEQLVKPNVPEDKWALLEENIRRLEEFVENGRAEMLRVHDDKMLSNLDKVFGSDVLLLVDQKLEQINELLSHSTYGEAACNVAEVQDILNEVIDILNWVHYGLYVAEGICFFVCQPALPVITACEMIINSVLDVLRSIRDILDIATPANADPTSWHIKAVGPYPGTDPYIMFTDTNYTMSLYVDFSNGGFNKFIGGISTLGKIVLDLLDIDIGKITVDDVQVASTVVSMNTSLINNLTTGDSPDVAADIHNLQINQLPTDVTIASTDIDVQASCGPYHYPDKICHGSSCLGPDVPVYPEFYDVNIIEAPIIESMQWDDEYSGWDVWGLGFSDMCGDVFKVYWNGEEVPCDCIDSLNYDSFIATDKCKFFDEPGRIELVLVDPTDPYNPDKQRHGPTQSVGLTPYDNLTIYNVIPSSGYIGDIVTVMGDHFSPYTEDMWITFDLGNNITKTIHPLEVSTDWMPNAWDTLTFEVPEALHGYEGQSIPFRIYLESDISIGTFFDSSEFNLRRAESAAWGDQDLIAFGKSHGYIRSAAVGDIDGDGVNDLIVGVSQDQSGLGEVNGSVFIAFGPVEGTLLPTGQQYIDLDINATDIHWDVVISGDYENCYLDSSFCRRIGNSIALGDINGDGMDDVVIGSTDQNEDGLHEFNTFPYGGSKGHITGGVLIYYGRPREQWNRWYDIPRGEYDILIYGDDQRELGRQVAVGDLNGDSYADIVVSAPAQLFNPSKPDLDWSGRVYVIFGSDSLRSEIDVNDVPTSVNGIAVAGESVWQGTDAYKGDGLGEGIAVGDINGDGVDDLLVGAPRFHRNYSSYVRKGAAFLFYGGGIFGGDGNLAAALYGGEQDVLILGPTPMESPHEIHPGWEIGRSMIIGDLDNDGKGEVILGAPDEFLDYEYTYGYASVHIQDDHIGLVYILPGNAIPQSGITGISGTQIYGSTTISRLGASLAIADVNNDGYKDLLVGAPGRIGAEAPGNVWGFYGSDNLPSGAIHLTDRSGAPDDFLIKGDQIHSDSPHGFGTFITAGDLNPFVGDDVLIIDPLARAPEPSDLNTWRDYSGMLYVFYEGAEDQWHLSIYPASINMSNCDDQQLFRAYGGKSPYLFVWDTPNVPDEIKLDYQYGDSTALLNINGCIPQGFYSLAIKVYDADGNDAVATVNFPQPDIFVSPSSIDFGDIDIKYSANRNITVTNTGNGDLQINNIYLTGSLDISQTNDCPGILLPQESCTVTISFSPSIEGLYGGTLYIKSNDPDAGAVDIPVTGNGIAPRIPDIVVIGGNPVFIDVPTGSSQAQDIIIKNNGRADLHINNVSVSGASEFAITSNDCIGTLPPYTPPYSTVTCTITVTFIPTGTDPVYGTISIESDDPDTPVFTGNLSGNGIAPYISVTPSSIDFEDVSDEALLTIQNTSSSQTLNWSITDDLPAWLTVSQMNGETGPGALDRLTVTVNREGLAPGIYSHTILITSNGGNASVELTMEVSQVTPVLKPLLSVQPLTLDFGAVNTDDSFTIKNDGNAALTWDITANLPGWLSVSPVTGSDLPGQATVLSVSVNRDGLAPGAYSHTISITSNGGNSSVAVSMDVISQPSLSVSPQNVSMNPCGDEHLFTATGGTAPYSFELVGVIGNREAVPDVIDLTDNGNGTAVVGINPCGLGMDTNASAQDTSVSTDWIPNAGTSDGYTYDEDTSSTYLNTTGSANVQCGATVVTLKVTDSTGTEAETHIAFNLGQTGWAKTYGGINFEDAKSIKQTSDGGYIVAGSTTSFGADPLNYDFWVIKVYATGVPEWQKKFDFSRTDIVTAILEAFDQQGNPDGYIIAGGGMISGGSNILKLHPDGAIEWQKSYKSNIYEANFTINAIRQTPDSGYVVVGTFSYEDEHTEILKLDSGGNIQWNKSLGEDYDSNHGADMDITADGGYIIIGSTYLDANIVIHKIAENGDVRWALAYGAPTLNEYGTSIRQTFDRQGAPDGYIVAGITESPTAGKESRDIWIFKLENNGEIRWQKTIGGAGRDDTPSVSQTSDGGYIVSARTGSFGEPNGDFWIIKLNSIGEIQWQKTYGGSGMEQPYSIQQTGDGGYVVGGATRSFGSGDSDVWVLKLNPDGTCGCLK